MTTLSVRIDETLVEAARVSAKAEFRSVQGQIEYIAFPEALKGKYQSFTQADLTKLREAGYDAPFLSVEVGVAQYVQWLHAHV